MTITDEELNNLSAQKQTIIKNYDSGYISEETYNEQLKEMQEKIDSKVRALIDNHQKKVEEKKVLEEKQMEEEQAQAPAQEEKKEVGRKPIKNSYATAIESVLKMKTIKNIDQAVEKLEEVKPGRERAKNISQIKTIIRETKKGKGRWAKYNWDEEAFLLTEKQ